MVVTACEREVVTALWSFILVDRAAIFSDILTRNTLRREAQLPSLDIRSEYAQILRHELWRVHVEQHREGVRAQVLRNYRKRHGVEPVSAGGMWMINAQVNMALAESFKTL